MPIVSICGRLPLATVIVTTCSGGQWSSHGEHGIDEQTETVCCVRVCRPGSRPIFIDHKISVVYLISIPRLPGGADQHGMSIFLQNMFNTTALL